jgi:hypothetical protein
MSITGVGSAGTFVQPLTSKVSAQQAQAAAAQSSSEDASAASDTPNASDKAVQDFLAYMKESPAQRVVDAWLKAHGLTEQSLAKLPPEKQAAIRKEMAADIKTQIDQQMEQKTGAVPTAGSLASVVV